MHGCRVIPWDMGNPLATGIPLRKVTHFPPSVANYEELHGEEDDFRKPRPSSMIALHMAWGCAGFVQVITVTMSSCVQQQCHVYKAACHSTPPHRPALPFFLSLPLRCFLLLRDGDFEMDGCSIYAWLSTPSFLFFKQLWVSSLATLHYHKTGFPTSWTAQMYECKYKYLEVTLTTWLFSKTTSTGPPLGPKTSLAIFYPPVFIVEAWIAKRWQVRMNYSQRYHYRFQEKLTYMLGKLFTITKSQVSKLKHLYLKRVFQSMWLVNPFGIILRGNTTFLLNSKNEILSFSLLDISEYQVSI